jgi:5-methylcytosine-specific restriction endonuclease McrA
VATRSGSSRPELSKGHWRALRRRVRYRDGNTCQSCGKRGADGHRLSVHHIQRGGPDVMANLITLCSSCHARADANARKRASTREDALRQEAQRRYGFTWSRHWFGGFDLRCPACRKLGEPCEDADGP